jgi:hypothetical protein
MHEAIFITGANRIQLAQKKNSKANNMLEKLPKIICRNIFLSELLKQWASPVVSLTLSAEAILSKAKYSEAGLYFLNFQFNEQAY